MNLCSLAVSSAVLKKSFCKLHFGFMVPIFSNPLTKIYVCWTVNLLRSLSLDNDQLDEHTLYFILHYVYYNPLHVSSIICSSSGGWIILMQHLVPSSRSVAVRCTGWERTAEQFSLNLCTGRPLTERTIPDAASV